MNTYVFEQLEKGMTESFSVAITEEMMSSFKSITGDINPLHNSAEFAVAGGYKDRVVYGMLSSSFLSTLAGVYLPGKNSLVHSVEVNFARPVYVGDVLNVSGKIIELSDTVVNRITLKVVIMNQEGEKVLRGKMIVGVMK
ncbi:MAG: dehydratase [Lachnospiraceae bacterium]|nr:dehydratase [Lachnospiraceae bacterium]